MPSRSQLRRALQRLPENDGQAAHGIVHLMEGDLPNARYWYRQAKRAFPAKADALAEIRALKGELRRG